MKPFSFSFSLISILSLLLTSISACSQTSEVTVWQSPLYQDHPLVGKVWRSADNSFISADELLQAVAAARYVLLGEKHDNPDHHALQRRIIDQLIAADKLSAMAFEMMDTDHQSLLTNIEPQHLAGLDQLHEYLQWDDEGWDWEFYGPLLLAGLQASVPMSGANITAATMTQVYGEPLPDHVAAVLDQDVMEQLNKDIDESHCGLLPESQFPAMVRVQQARDQQMAISMLPPQEDKLSLLVAGNYHIRQDLGVPNYLFAANTEIESNDVISVAFIEVSPAVDDGDSAGDGGDRGDGSTISVPGSESAEVYLQQFSDVKAYDYIWFTPVVSEEDYCAALR